MDATSSRGKCAYSLLALHNVVYRQTGLMLIYEFVVVQNTVAENSGLSAVSAFIL